MISNLSPQAQHFLADMERVQAMVADASRQVSSGKKVNVASDAPDIISHLLQLRANLQKNTQISHNLGIAQADANVSESALSSATQLMDRALTLAAQGATATTDADGRASLAAEIQSIQEQMVAYSLTQSAGRYVFSGDLETMPAYAVDLNNVNASGNGDGTGTGAGVDQLITAGSTRAVENPAGGSFAVSMTAQQIFDTRDPADPTQMAPDNVFASLDNLRLALLANDTSAINSSIDETRQASLHLNDCLAFYGTVQNRIEDATNFAGNYDIQLQTQIGQLEDADIAAASLELSQGTAQLQAGFQMEARIPRTTLFDFLNS